MAASRALLFYCIVCIVCTANALELSRRCAIAGVCGCGCKAIPALALADLVSQPQYSSTVPPVQRNEATDASFACTMANGMKGYERAAAPIKERLFSSLFAPGSGLPSDGAVIVEVGIGTFPNAPYYTDALQSGFQHVDIVGVDPNVAMEPFAQTAHRQSKLASASTLRVVRGVAEALPLADRSADAIVCTLTLCSVVDPAAALREMVRVLRPGGRLVFLEHVLSEDDPFLAQQQLALTPLQSLSADGCHLDRRTLETVRQTRGFASVDASITKLDGFWYLSPTAAGVAIKA